MKFSLFVVSLNAGESLCETVHSLLKQKNVEMEIIVKDGGSTDGSVEKLPKDPRVAVYVQKDTGIYDGMNQAMSYATGDFGLFMNCGDRFYDDEVLYNVSSFISEYQKEMCDAETIFYGDCYTANRGYRLSYPDVFDDYVCFTKTLCHQTTIYPSSLMKKRAFSADYRIAADYEYYVYAYKNGYKLKHIPLIVASYQGGGASETIKNRQLAVTESRCAIQKHFSPSEYRKVYTKALFRGVMLKRFLVCVGWLYPVYSYCATIYYRLKRPVCGEEK